MIYTFSKTVFDDSSDRVIDHINKIWYISKDRHFLYIGSSNDLSCIVESSWFKSLRESNQEEIKQQFVSSTTKSRRDVAIVVDNTDVHSYSLDEAFELLSKPLTIVLENIEYDSFFFHAILRCYKEGRKITEHIDKGWVVFQNGGGNNIINVINGMKERFEKNKKDFPKGSHIYIRTFIIIDSDKTYPSADEVAPDKVDLLNIIKRNSNYHVLLKREIENYLPISIIESEIPNHDKNLEFKTAYINLTPVQRDYFDLEKGLHLPKVREDSNAALLDLYDGVPADVLNSLRNHKFTFYKSNSKKENFKPAFARLFLSQNITRQKLEEVLVSSNPNEFIDILRKITNLL